MSASWRRYARFWRADPARDVNEELAFHLEMRAQYYTDRGVDPREARRLAESRFGDRGQVEAECRRTLEGMERRRAFAGWWSDLRQDLWWATRGLWRDRGFAAAAVLTLALGIGANGALLGVANAYLFRPFPARDPASLVAIAQTQPEAGLPSTVSYPNLEDLRTLSAFEGIAAWSGNLVALQGDATADPEPRYAQFVTGNYFTMLGLRAPAGRLLLPGDETRRERVVVLGHALWQSRFGGAAGVIGRTVQVNGLAYTVVGIAPEGFHGAEPLLDPSLFLPLSTMAELDPSRAGWEHRRGAAFLKVLGRLAPGATVETANAAASVLARRLDREHAEVRPGDGFLVVAERKARPEIAIAGTMPKIAAVFGGLVALVLLISCANVANLMLARGSARRLELAVRRALGAGAGRLVRQLLTESLLLGVLGLGLGFVFAIVITRALAGIDFALDVPLRLDILPDARVFALTACVAILAGVVTGIAPALGGARVPSGAVLRDGTRTAGDGRHRLRGMLVIAQVAVSLVLLVAAGLFVRSVLAAMQVDLGFRSEGVLLLSTDASLVRYDEERAKRYHLALAERVARLPGVEAAAVAAGVPMGGNNSSISVHVQDAELPVADGKLEVFYNRVSPGYFELLRVPVRAGRTFGRADSDSAPPVAIVNEALVRRLWPDRGAAGAVGRRFRFSEGGPEVEVVGVVADSRYIMLHEAPRPFLYAPFTQRGSMGGALHVRTSGDPAALASQVRAVVRELEPGMPILRVETMTAHLRDGVAYFFVRLAAWVAGALGVLALVQTLVGLYGVVSFGVVQRRREIGIRMALGASARDVVRGVMLIGIRMTTLGVVIGLALAFVTTRLVQGLLLGVGAWDPVAMIGAVVVLGACATLAAWVPARRAAGVEPVQVLRE